MAGPSPSPSPTPQIGANVREAGNPPLLGRDREVRTIADFVERAGREGGALVLSGEAGVGKTALLNAAAEHALAQGTDVVRAAGVQFEADISYAVLNQLLFPFSGGFDELTEHQRTSLEVALGLAGGMMPDRMAVSNACLALLRRQAERRPLLLVIDDLPWVDRPSAVVLGFVARRLSGTRLGLVTAARTEDEDFLRDSGLPELEIRPISDDAADELVRSAYPALAARARQRIVRQAEGNPLALLELPEALRDAQQSTSADLSVLPLRDRRETLFASRIARLPPRTRETLLVIALEGTGDLQVLHKAAGGDEIWRVLAPAEQAHLVSIDMAARRISFRHPLVRSAVVESSTHVDRRRVHALLADLFAAAPDQFSSASERHAWHRAEASLEPDEEVALLLEEVAHRKLDRGDASGAVAALIRATHLSPRAADRSRRLSEAAYIGADITGELSSASNLLDQARQTDPGLGGSLHAAAAAAYVLLNGDGVIDTAHRLLVTAIETGEHGWAAERDDLVEALHALVLTCYLAGREEFWPPLFDAIGRLKPAPPEELLVMSSTTDVTRMTPDIRRRLVHLIDQQAAAPRPNVFIRVSTAAVYLDLLGPCRAACRHLVDSGRTNGTVRSSLGALMHLCLDDFATGRWEEMQQLADEGQALSSEHGYDFAIWYFYYHQALLASVRGDDEAAQRWANEVTRVTTQRRAYGAARFAHHPRTLAAIARGDFEAAYHHACDLSPAGQLAPYTPHAMWVALDLVEAALRTNRRAEAEAHARAMQEAGLPGMSSRLALFTAAARALVAPDAEARALFADALSAPGAENWPFDHARVQLLYGERLRRSRALTDARAQLGAALNVFQRLGAVPWANRASAELRAAGRPGPQATPPGAAAELTAQELEIALLAAEGMTNKQIGERLHLSPRTVGTHMYHVFPKLGITSRAALRDALSR